MENNFFVEYIYCILGCVIFTRKLEYIYCIYDIIFADKFPKNEYFYIKKSTLEMDCSQYIEKIQPLLIKDPTEVIIKFITSVGFSISNG